jgi:hypothetical protein
MDSAARASGRWSQAQSSEPGQPSHRRVSAGTGHGSNRQHLLATLAFPVSISRKAYRGKSGNAGRRLLARSVSPRNLMEREARSSMGRLQKILCAHDMQRSRSRCWHHLARSSSRSVMAIKSPITYLEHVTKSRTYATSHQTPCAREPFPPSVFLLILTGDGRRRAHNTARPSWQPPQATGPIVQRPEPARTHPPGSLIHVSRRGSGLRIEPAGTRTWF